MSQMAIWGWARTGLFKLGPKECQFSEMLINITGEKEFCGQIAFRKKSPGLFIAKLLRAFHTLMCVRNLKEGGGSGQSLLTAFISTPPHPSRHLNVSASQKTLLWRKRKCQFQQTSGFLELPNLFGGQSPTLQGRFQSPWCATPPHHQLLLRRGPQFQVLKRISQPQPRAGWERAVGYGFDSGEEEGSRRPAWPTSKL